MDLLIKKIHKRNESEKFKKRFLGKVNLVSKNGHAELISKSTLIPIEKIKSKIISRNCEFKRGIRSHVTEQEIDKSSGRALDNIWKIPTKKLRMHNKSYESYATLNKKPNNELDVSIPPLNKATNNEKYEEIKTNRPKIVIKTKNIKPSIVLKDKFKKSRNYSSNRIQLEKTINQKSTLTERELQNTSIDELKRIVDLAKPKVNVIILPVICNKPYISERKIDKTQELTDEPRNHISKSIYRKILQQLIQNDNSYSKRNTQLKKSKSSNIVSSVIRNNSNLKRKQDWLEKITGLHGFL